MFVTEGEKKQVKHEVCIPVRLGDTIPGYVAATKILINVNVIKQVCNLAKGIPDSYYALYL